MTIPTNLGSKPTILIVPGSFSPPSMYQSIVDDLNSTGYDATAIYLPTVGDSKKVSGVTLADDAAAIQGELRDLIDEQGKDVILVTHSYGGIAGAEGAKGFSKTIREANQQRGGIVRLVYVTALIARVGQSLLETMKDCPTLDNVIEEVSLDIVALIEYTESYQNGYMSMKPIPSAHTLFTNLPQDQGLHWVAEMPGHSCISFDNPATYEAFRDIPMTYMICEEDLIIPAEVQREMVEMVERETGRKVDVYSYPVGHVPNITAWKDVVTTIRAAAGEKA
jgi:pimeloyl-ACP methyl ester carboxylesterase